MEEHATPLNFDRYYPCRGLHPGTANTTSTDWRSTAPGPSAWRSWRPPTPTLAALLPTALALRWGCASACTGSLLRCLVRVMTRARQGLPLWCAIGLKDGLQALFSKHYLFHSSITYLNCSVPMLQIVDLSAPDLAPEGWEEESAPPQGPLTDISVYELHIRDFSATDSTVPAHLQGKYLAFSLVCNPPLL